MATTTQHMLTTTSTERTDKRHALPWALLAALIALAALTVAVATWQLTATTNTAGPASQVPKAAADQWAASRPGGSIYEQQVPKAAADQWAASRPGGSIYEQQVPKAAADQWAASRPGGSIYEQQVPKAAR